MSERWEAPLRALEEQDRAAPPDPGAMLFSGGPAIARYHGPT